MVLFTVLGSLCYLASIGCLLGVVSVAFHYVYWKDVAGFLEQKQRGAVEVGMLATLVFGKIFMVIGTLHH